MIQTMQDHLDKETTAKANGTAEALPDSLLDRVIVRITIECQRLESEGGGKKSGPGSEYLNLASGSGEPNAIRVHDKNPKGIRCTNCKRKSHDVDHCWSTGGGMAGQGPKQSASTTKPPAKADGREVASIASIPEPFMDDGEISCAMIEGNLDSDDDEEVALLMMSHVKALLDSGASSHLIRAKEYFHSYDELGAKDVTTANLGTLRTYGGGTCYADVTFRGKTFRIRFNNCLHAPDAAVNLISVGRLVAARVGCTFIDDGVVLTKAGVGFAEGTMTSNHLFSMNISFVPAPACPPLTPVAATIENAMYSHVPESADLWHNRFGHPGERATHIILRRIVGTPLADSALSRCEPCIIAKHVAHPHPQSAIIQRPYGPLELIVADLCGPFPVHTPHGKLHFVAFRCVGLKVNNVQLLATKSAEETLEAFKILRAKWEKRLGRPILAFRCDGGSEWMGVFAAYLAEHGISLDVTPPYEHWMNGEAERLMRTMQERMLAMMTTAQLSMTYWGEAALTACYLLNVTTLNVDGVTPFELMHQRRPNLAHLRVWGVRCFAHVPAE